jgi:hypothetical protein
MAIFLWPYSRAPSMAIFSLALRPCLTAISIFSSPHGDYQFFFASRQESISFRLMAIHASRRLSIFSLPHGKNQFHSALWQFTPHGNYRFFLCLTARIDFIPPDGNLLHTALSIFSSPHGNNRFFLCSKESSSYNLSGHFMRGIFSFLVHPF